MQEQIKKQAKKQDKQVDETTPQEAVDRDETLEALDDLLDEIDAILEENAEEFVSSFIQKGGE